MLGVDEQVEKLRQRVQAIMSDEPGAAVALISAQALQELVANLREANAYLVIASINAKQLQSKAEATNQLQALFISKRAHELRNPLAPIAMVVALLGKLVQDDARLEHLHGTLAHQTGHLTRLVDVLMDVTRKAAELYGLQHFVQQLASHHLFDWRIHVARGFFFTSTDVKFSGDKRLSTQFLADAIVVQRYVELQGQFKRVISVVKVRGSAHAKDLRLYDIGEGGLEIEPLAMPYTDILSGHPQAG